MTPQTPLKIGFVGCGGISHMHMKGILAQPDLLKVAACAEVDAEKAKKWSAQYKVERVFEDWTEMVRAVRPDIVLFATWPSQHLEQVTAAAELGVPAILCEKSLALSAAEGRAMAAACEKSGTLLMEAFMYRHGPRTKDFLKRVHQGDLGEIRYAWAAFSASHYNPKGDNWRQRKETGGGIVYDFTCYCVNILRGIMGRAPKRVSSAVEVCPEREIIIVMHSLLDYGDGVAAHVESSMKECVRMEAQAVGREGTLTLPIFLMNAAKCDPPPMRLTTGSLFTSDYLETEIPTVFENPYALQIGNLARALRDGEPLGMPLEESLDNLRTIDAMVAAAESGRFEEVAP